MNIKTINILVFNRSGRDVGELLAKTQEFFLRYGWDINFSFHDLNEGYHAYLYIKDAKWLSAGAEIRVKWDGHYKLTYKFGKLIYANTYEEVLIHEILHLFFQEFGLGDIHYRPGAATMGQKNNDNAMRHWFYYARLLNNSPDKAIVHHTAHTTWDYNQVRHFHINDKGWVDIAYHYFIEKDGRLKIGRWLAKQGSHCLGQNTRSAGICLAGHYNIEYPPTEQTATHKKLLVTLGYKVIGPHRRWQAYRVCYGTLLSDSWAQNLMPRLIRLQGTGDIWVCEGKFRNLIFNGYTFERGMAPGKRWWGNWDAVEDVSKAEFDRYEERDAIIILPSD